MNIGAIISEITIERMMELSCYEEINGNGALMKKDLQELKKKMFEANNEQYDNVKKKYHLSDSDMINIGLKRATTRDTKFPFNVISSGETFFDKKTGKEKFLIEAYEYGEVILNFEENTFHFYTERNNHTVDRLQKSSTTYKKLIAFIEKLEIKGTKYGAQTYYTNEYHVDEYGHTAEGDRTYYGGWVPNNERKYRKVN